MKKFTSIVITGCLGGALSVMLSSFAIAGGCISSDCAAMGYTKTVSQCSGYEMIRCPFDTSKVFCQEPEVCPGYITGGDCPDGQTKEFCADDSNYYKCVGVACEEGYSTALKEPAILQNLCKVAQSSNSQCTKIIDAGTCGAVNKTLSQCPRGTKSCTNACGETRTRCCAENESGCLTIFDPSLEPAPDWLCKQCGTKGVKKVGSTWQCCSGSEVGGIACIMCATTDDVTFDEIDSSVFQ